MTWRAAAPLLRWPPPQLPSTEATPLTSTTAQSSRAKIQNFRLRENWIECAWLLFSGFVLFFLEICSEDQTQTTQIVRVCNMYKFKIQEGELCHRARCSYRVLRGVSILFNLFIFQSFFLYLVSKIGHGEPWVYAPAVLFECIVNKLVLLLKDARLVSRCSSK